MANDPKRAEIDRLIDAAGEHAEEIRATLRPRVGLTALPWVGSTLEPGASRLGGPADLPPGLAWPECEGRPMALLAQFDFANLVPSHEAKRWNLPLPTTGWLCLFIDSRDPIEGIAGRDAHVAAMQFAGDAASLVRHDPQPAPDANLWTHCHRAIVCPADFNLVLPHAECYEAADFVRQIPEDDYERLDHYSELVVAVEDVGRCRASAHLLGYPHLLNPDPRPGPDWTLLAHFDGESPWAAGVGDGDGYPRRADLGTTDALGYYVRCDDLAAGRLDRGAFARSLS